MSKVGVVVLQVRIKLISAMQLAANVTRTRGLYRRNGRTKTKPLKRAEARKCATGAHISCTYCKLQEHVSR